MRGEGGLEGPAQGLYLRAVDLCLFGPFQQRHRRQPPGWRRRLGKAQVDGKLLGLGRAREPV